MTVVRKRMVRSARLPSGCAMTSSTPKAGKSAAQRAVNSRLPRAISPRSRSR